METESSKYWFEFHKICSVLFRDMDSGKDVKELVDRIIMSLLNIEESLLSKIECLNENGGVSSGTSTKWLLHGLMKAAICPTLKNNMKNNIETQQKILRSTFIYQHEVFVDIINLYVEELGSVLKFSTESHNFLHTKDHLIVQHDFTLYALAFHLDQNYWTEYLVVLLEVLSGVKYEVLWHCHNTHPMLWSQIAHVIKIKIADVQIAALPLLEDMMALLEIPPEFDVMSVCCMIPGLITMDKLMSNDDLLECIKGLWQKGKIACGREYCANKEFVKSLMHVNNMCFAKELNIEEISLLLSGLSDDEVSELVEEFQTELSQDVVLMLVDCITRQVVRHLEKLVEKGHELPASVSVDAASHMWKWVLSRLNIHKIPQDNLLWIPAVTKAACQVLMKLKSNQHFTKSNVSVVFFSEHSTVLLKSLLNAYATEQKKVALESLCQLMSLPEGLSIPLDELRSASQLLTQAFHSQSFFTKSCLQESDTTTVHLLLKSLWSLSSGLECLSIFSKCATNSSIALSQLNIQSVSSVPFLFLLCKVSPSKLICDVLMPGALSGRDDVQVAVLDAAVELVCCLAGSSHLSWDKDGERLLECCECKSATGGGAISTSRRDSSSVDLVEAHLLKLLNTILKSTKTTVKLKLISSLGRLTTHWNGVRNRTTLDSYLSYLSDENEQVRFEFSSQVTYLVFGRRMLLQSRTEKMEENDLGSENSGDKLSVVSALEMVLYRLELNIHLALARSTQRKKQDSLLSTLTNIACVPVSAVLSKCIRLLLLYVGKSCTALPGIFLQISTAHRSTPMLLYYTYRHEISEVIGLLISINRLRYNLTLRCTMSEVMSILEGLSETRFISGGENNIVSILIIWMMKNNQLEDIISDWAEFSRQPVPTILSRCFPSIYTTLVLTETKEVFDKALSWIEETTKIKTSDFVIHSQKLITNQLLFNYCRGPDKALSALRAILCESDHEDVKDKLATRLVGYLQHIVSKFVKDVNSESQCVRAIQSLTAVVQLMGTKHITPVVRVVLSALQTTLTMNKQQFYPLQFRSWDVFIRILDPRELGPLLATFVVSVLPFLLHMPEDVAKVLSYLVVDHENAVKSFLPGLIYLPDHPALQPVLKVLQPYIKFPCDNVKDRLTREVALVHHETVGVRLEGLKALKTTLETCSSDVQNLIIGSDEPDTSVTRLLETLVLCCNDPEPDIFTTAASCLGLLGAVDPGLLPRKPKPKNQHPLSVHDPAFAFLALSEMARAFQNARRSVDMDAFAIAIQELLKTYKISNRPEDVIWSKFPQQTQSLMVPLLTSYYKVQVPKRSTWPEVIFGSQEAGTHIKWASLWASKLVSFCKDDRAVYVFSICEPSLTKDTKILLFFLRYILLHAILRDASVHAVILSELDAVLQSSQAEAAEQDATATEYRPIRGVEYCGFPKLRSAVTGADSQSCLMTVFLLLDFLQYWLRMYRATNCTQSGDHLLKRDYVLVKDFVEKVDLMKVSRSNYNMQEYARAIVYLEDVICKAPGTLPEHLPMLSKAYALHGDLDSVAGAATCQKTSPKMEDLLLTHLVSGHLEDVRVMYERLGKDGQMTPQLRQEMIQCYLNLGEPFTAYSCIQAATAHEPHLTSLLSESTCESLLKMGDYKQLTKTLNDNPPSTKWFSQLSRILVNMHNNRLDEVPALICKTRVDVVEALKLTGLQFGGYQQGYSSIVKLQILKEVETVHDLVTSDRPGTRLRLMTDDWLAASNVVETSPSCLEPFLSMRRILLSLVKEKMPDRVKPIVDAEIAKCWVKSAEVARKARCFHQAYNYILNAEQFDIPCTFIEKAQLFWDKGEQDKCLFTLNRGIKEYFSDWATMKVLKEGERLDERKMCAEAMLLYAGYSEETSNCDHSTNVSNYRNAFDVCRQLEKSQAYLAQCLDRVVTHMENQDYDTNNIWDLKVSMIHHFGSSLGHGCEYIYQTVPRMLSIWLDMGEKVDSPEKTTVMTKINRLIQLFADGLPPFVLMTALPQLLSRLGHPNREVFLILKSILVSLLKAFPQQCLWAVQTVAKSSVPERVKRYNELIQDPGLRSAGLFKLINDFTNLCDKLNRLTNRTLQQDAAFRGLKVSSVVRELPPLFTSDKFSPIIIPITRFCSISLPRNVSSASHEPFPKHAVYIRGIEDEMIVLPSLQRPRKITLMGTDGKHYDILCKPKDDLRRDGRLMEFNNIVNMYLHRDPESRARGLHIRTYAVTPLGEGGGLLEWVPNLVGLRPALIKLYKQFGKYTNTREIKRFECQVRDSLEKKRSVFTDNLLVLHPALLPEWFRLTFPDPAGWFIARQAYVRTTAVMSMVGYILGLGDRHGENILFDSESGDTVHVDFNCLFNKGEKFDWKERVPFRLTHNMVAAMGPFGVEGTYRKSCETSLRVLRSQVKTLMSVLTPFAYDPFGSWGKNKEIVQTERDQKIGEALEELSDIEKRLNGSLRVKQKNTTLYLSVEGQVRSLIQEATDIDNLCRMYLGWGAYL